MSDEFDLRVVTSGASIQRLQSAVTVLVSVQDDVRVQQVTELQRYKVLLQNGSSNQMAAATRAKHAAAQHSAGGANTANCAVINGSI